MPKKRRRVTKPKNTAPKPNRVSKSSAQKPKPQSPMPTVVEKISSSEPQYSYVGREVRQILLISGGFVLLQLVVWALFSQTGLEAKLSQLIKL